jgi:hypothetical protein
LKVLVLYLSFFLIDLQGYDSVLGAQWLKTLGPIVRDFASLHMSFTWQGRRVTLVGINSHRNKLLKGPKMQREIHRSPEGIFLQFLAVDLGVEQQCPSISDPDLQQLLEEFRELFEESQASLLCAGMTTKFP